MAPSGTPNEQTASPANTTAAPPSGGVGPPVGLAVAESEATKSGFFSSARVKIIAVLIAMVLVTAGGSIAAILINQATMTLTGTWSYTSTSSASGPRQNGTIDLKQQGSSVIGTIKEADGTVLTITGTLSGQTIMMSFSGSLGANGQAQVTISGTVDSAYDAMNGTYTATVTISPGSPPITDHGTWNATKTART